MSEKPYTNPHGNFSRTILRRSRGSRSMQGYGDDQGKYFRCSQCGFMVNKDNSLFNPVDGVSGANPVNGGEMEISTRVRAGESTEYLVDHNGENIIATASTADVSSGCPFCGSQNYR